MRSTLTRRPLPLPADVLEQLVEIAASKEPPVEFKETAYVPSNICKKLTA